MEFANNFLNIEIKSKHIDYFNVSKKMAELHRRCFNVHREQFNSRNMFSFLKYYQYHVFYNKISLAIIQVSGFEADLIDLIVSPNQQNNGIGSNLLHLVILYLKDRGVGELFLEVDINNKNALKTYDKLNFRSCGARKNYYAQDNGLWRDAVIMSCNLSGKSGKLDKKKLQRLYPTG